MGVHVTNPLVNPVIILEVGYVRMLLKCNNSLKNWGGGGGGQVFFNYRSLIQGNLLNDVQMFKCIKCVKLAYIDISFFVIFPFFMVHFN